MPVRLEIENDDQVRSYIKSLIAGQVKAIVRSEFEAIIREELSRCVSNITADKQEIKTYLMHATREVVHETVSRDELKQTISDETTKAIHDRISTVRDFELMKRVVNNLTDLIVGQVHKESKEL